MKSRPSHPSPGRQQIGETIIVHKLDSAGNEIWHYPGEVLRTTQASVTLVAIFDREDRSLGGIELRHGDRFIETFYRDRWYNVFRIHDGQENHLKGWYCNITRPARIEPGHIYAEDLALDLVVLPNAEHQVLDEDEFEALTLNPEERKLALLALEELKTLASRDAAPFEIST